jgi:hypothetical protein
MTVTSDLSDVATTVTYGKYRLAVTTANMVIKLNGETAPPSEDDTTVYVIGSKGNLLSIDGADEDSGPDVVMQMLQSVTFPGKKLKIGDSWQTVTGGIYGLPGVQGSFKILALETVAGQECFKISGTIKQTGGGPSSTTATWWISLAEGMPVKFDGSFKQIPIAEIGLVDLKVQMIRVK